MPKIKNIKKKHQGINMDVVVIYKTLGDHLLHLGKIQESIDYFNKAILYNPYYTEVYNEKADALVLQDKYQEALITINKAIIKNHIIMNYILIKVFFYLY